MANEQTTFSWETVVSIIGALAWTPYILGLFNKSKLNVKIISTADAHGNFNEKIGSIHFLKLSITCTNKQFNIKDIFIEVKYKNNLKFYKGSIFWARLSSWKIGKDTKKLVIPHEQHLAFANMFELDKSGFYYLTFITDHNEKDKFEFEEIKIHFRNIKGENISLNFNKNKLEPDRILFDDSIWQ